MTIFIKYRHWALIWMLFEWDAQESINIICRVELRKQMRAWWGYMIRWDEKPDWKHLPTNGALRVAVTAQGKTVAYVFRGPIERIPMGQQ